MLNPAIFLDRDGVLNKSIVHNGKPYAPRSMEAFEILPGVQKLLHLLKDFGYKLIVVTNQPDVGNGLVEKQIVDSMHEYIKQNLPIDQIKVCYHSQKAECLCRKPKPGMLTEAANELKIDLKKSVMIGDRLGDIQAGQSVGCRTIFIDYQYGEPKPTAADFIVGSVAEITELFTHKAIKGFK